MALVYSSSLHASRIHSWKNQEKGICVTFIKHQVIILVLCITIHFKIVSRVSLIETDLFQQQEAQTKNNWHKLPEHPIIKRYNIMLTTPEWTITAGSKTSSLLVQIFEPAQPKRQWWGGLIIVGLRTDSGKVFRKLKKKMKKELKNSKIVFNIWRDPTS
jgi:hypothetical protein